MDVPDRSEAELATLVAELRETLDQLGDSVERDRDPTPPGPRELLRFTESYTIPTVIALLESAVRALELLQATLRLVDGRGVERRERTGEVGRGAGAVGRTTVDNVDRALSGLTAALEGEAPEGPARDLLADARALREEVDERLRESEWERGGARERGGEGDTDRRRSADDGGHRIPVVAEGETPPMDVGTEDEHPQTVDVDAELASIRDEVARERGESADDPDERGAAEGRSGGDEDDGDEGSDGKRE
jgi:hypothetical protein